MSNPPSLTITALGTPGSGKTTFLLGMYAELSVGCRGYFLNAVDPDVDLRLAGLWDRLMEDGQLPPPNHPANISYRFRFLDGMTSLLDIDWLDYRGGALLDERDAEAGDVRELHERLLKSDSVYFVLDAGYLVDPVTPTTRRDLLRETGLRRMSALLQNSLQERAALDDPPPPPSIVILLTKADLLPPQRRDDLDDLALELQELISVGFATGLSTMICPVSLGDFGMTPAATVRTSDIEPVDLHLPIIYSLAEYMYQLSVLAKHVSSSAIEARQAVTSELSSIRMGAGALFQRSRIKELENVVVDIGQQSEDYDRVHQRAAERASQLFRELERLPRFRDGVEVRA